MANLNRRLGLQNSLLRRVQRHSQTAVLFRSAETEGGETPSAVTNYASIRAALDGTVADPAGQISPPEIVAPQTPQAAAQREPNPVFQQPPTPVTVLPTTPVVSQPLAPTPPVQRVETMPPPSAPPTGLIQPPAASASSDEPFSPKEWSRLSTIMRRHKEHEAAGGDDQSTSFADTVGAPWLKELVQKQEAEQPRKTDANSPDRPKPRPPEGRRRSQVMYVSDQVAAQMSPADMLRQTASPKLPSEPGSAPASTAQNVPSPPENTSSLIDGREAQVFDSAKSADVPSVQSMVEGAPQPMGLVQNLPEPATSANEPTRGETLPVSPQEAFQPLTQEALQQPTVQREVLNQAAVSASTPDSDPSPTSQQTVVPLSPEPTEPLDATPTDEAQTPTLSRTVMQTPEPAQVVQRDPVTEGKDVGGTELIAPSADQLSAAETVSAPEMPSPIQRQPIELGDQDTVSEYSGAVGQVDEHELGESVREDAQLRAVEIPDAQRASAKSQPFSSQTPAVQRQAEVDEAVLQPPLTDDTLDALPDRSQVEQAQQIQLAADVTSATADIQGGRDKSVDRLASPDPIVEQIGAVKREAETAEPTLMQRQAAETIPVSRSDDASINSSAPLEVVQRAEQTAELGLPVMPDVAEIDRSRFSHAEETQPPVGNVHPPDGLQRQVQAAAEIQAVPEDKPALAEAIQPILPQPSVENIHSPDAVQRQVQTADEPRVVPDETVLTEAAPPISYQPPVEPMGTAALMQRQVEEDSAVELAQQTAAETRFAPSSVPELSATDLEHQSAMAGSAVVQRQADHVQVDSLVSNDVVDVSSSGEEQSRVDLAPSQAGSFDQGASFLPEASSDSERTGSAISAGQPEPVDVMRKGADVAVGQRLQRATEDISSVVRAEHDQPYFAPASSTGRVDEGGVQRASLALDTGGVPAAVPLPTPTLRPAPEVPHGSITDEVPIMADREDRPTEMVQMKPAELYTADAQMADQPSQRRISAVDVPASDPNEPLALQRTAAPTESAVSAEVDSTDDVYQTQSLEEVWPVEQVQKPVYQVPDLIEPVSITPPVQEISRKPSSDDAQVQAHLQSVVSERPSDSSIELVLPRRPRPVVARKRAVQPSVEPEVSTAEVHNNSADSYTVETEIGALPSDLWQILGQAPPTTSPDSIQRTMDVQTAIAAAEKAAPTSSFVSESELSTSTHVQRSVQVEDDVPSFGSVLPEIQRDTPDGGAAAASSVPSDDFSPTEPPSDEQDGEKKKEEIDLDALAAQVYATLRKRLRFEQERNHRIF